MFKTLILAATAATAIAASAQAETKFSPMSCDAIAKSVAQSAQFMVNQYPDEDPQVLLHKTIDDDLKAWNRHTESVYNWSACPSGIQGSFNLPPGLQAQGKAHQAQLRAAYNGVLLKYDIEAMCQKMGASDHTCINEEQDAYDTIKTVYWPIVSNSAKTRCIVNTNRVGGGRTGGARGSGDVRQPGRQGIEAGG
jgi:hypothetical protein